MVQFLAVTLLVRSRLWDLTLRPSMLEIKLHLSYGVVRFPALEIEYFRQVPGTV